jgi:rhomboid protease GluP
MSHPLYQQPEAPQQSEDEESKPKRIGLRLPGIAERPYITYALLAINLGLFALKYIAPDFYLEHIIYPGISFTDGIVENKEFYRLFTAMFLHANEIHIAFNMLVLYQIGGYVERYFGHLRYIIIYLLGGLLGSLLMLFVSDAGLGASGAIFAIFGAQIAFLYRQRQLFGAVGRAQMWASVRIIALNLIIGIVANLGSQVAGGNPVIGNAAHFGGAVGGAILAWFIAPHFVLKHVENPQEGELPIRIEQDNRLALQLVPLLVYMIGLAIILYLAVLTLA